MGDETKPVCGKKLQTGLAIVFLLNVLWCKIARQVHGSSTEGIWIIFQTTCLLGEYRYLNTHTSRLFHLKKNWAQVCHLWFCHFASSLYHLCSLLGLIAPASVCIFSVLVSIHFLRCWQGEFVKQSRASFVGDHFLDSRDLNVWCRGDYCKEK